MLVLLRSLTEHVSLMDTSRVAPSDFVRNEADRVSLQLGLLDCVSEVPLVTVVVVVRLYLDDTESVIDVAVRGGITESVAVVK